MKRKTLPPRVQQAIWEEILEKFTPHDGQMVLARYVLKENKKIIFACCGRKFGKSTCVVLIAWLWALLYPGSIIYIFAPTCKQARELYWANHLLQGFGPQKYIKGRPNNQLLEINFKNGSRIKLDGSEMHQQYRGVECDMAVYEEYKDHHPDFHIAFEPNLGPRDATLFVVGTPPANNVTTQEQAFFSLAQRAKDSPKGAYLELPTHYNPHMSKDWLQETRDYLIKSGQEDVWTTEYMARFVKGGHKSIFPMFSRPIHFVPHQKLMKSIAKDLHNLQWTVFADPGSTSVFAMLLSAYNPFTNVLLCLEEIYETDQKLLSIEHLWPRCERLMQSLNPNHGGDWYKGYDEAAAWFRVEMQNRFSSSWWPTQKFWSKREAQERGEAKPGVGLVKAQLSYGKLFISDHCPQLAAEIESYIKDREGKIPKGNDHLIDCLRYTNFARNIRLDRVPIPEPEDRPFPVERIAMSRNEPLYHLPAGEEVIDKGIENMTNMEKTVEEGWI